MTEQGTCVNVCWLKKLRTSNIGGSFFPNAGGPRCPLLTLDLLFGCEYCLLQHLLLFCPMLLGNYNVQGPILPKLLGDYNFEALVLGE